MPVGSRVDDAVRRAGGASPGAELDAVHLAARLADRVEREDFVRAGCDLSYSDAAARDFLVQTYARDTGEVVVLLTVPIFVKGQRYGAATATWKAE